MEKKELQGWVASVSFKALFLGVALASAYSIGSASKDEPIARPSMRVGEIPVGQPVMLFWREDDGRYTGESAIRTDYAGTIPYTKMNVPVPYIQLEGWSAWCPLEEVMP